MEHSVANRLLSVFGTEHPVALVTGSGSPRVGAAIVRQLASRGYRMAIHARTSLAGAEETARKIVAAGGEAIACSADVSDEHSVAAMFALVRRRFGRIDLVVNAAAIWEKKDLEDATADDVRRHFESNALGTWLCCQAAGIAMIAQPAGGAIVNLGDWATSRPYRGYSAYFPSKGAVEAMTRSFAVELASRNPRIRVNAVLPGPVMLPEDLSLEERRRAIGGTLLKREGAPENVADAVIFLAENDYVTGICLPVDGGRLLCNIDDS